MRRQPLQRFGVVLVFDRAELLITPSWAGLAAYMTDTKLSGGLRTPCRPGESFWPMQQCRRQLILRNYSQRRCSVALTWVA
jgi:hypothetical protein